MFRRVAIGHAVTRPTANPRADTAKAANGLSEELSDHLAHSTDLKVIVRTSAFSFKGKNDDVRTIAATLGVAHLLAGSLRKPGNALRISAQLIGAADSTHLWSHTCAAFAGGAIRDRVNGSRSNP